MDFVIYWKTLLTGRRWSGAERGSAVVEYALLLALIAMVCLAAILVFGEETSQRYGSVAAEIDNVP